MATSGKKRKPGPLGLVGKHGEQPTPQIPERKEEIVPPKKLNITQQRIWDQYIEPAWWLQQGDALLCYIFVQLMSEYLRSPKNMIASRIGELRKSMAELHLTSSEQARLGIKQGDADPAEKFFNDQ